MYEKDMCRDCPAFLYQKKLCPNEETFCLEDDFIQSFIRYSEIEEEYQTNKIKDLFLEKVKKLREKNTDFIKKLNKGTLLYRARSFSNRQGVLDALKEPERNLGIPPKEKASYGRFNRLDFPTFYAALAEETAIYEVCPQRQDYVVTAQFETKEDLKVIDLSVFYQPDFWKQKTDLKEALSFFLLLKYLLMPISSDRRDVFYKDTCCLSQVIADSGFNGILYPSSCFEARNKLNIALFITQREIENKKYFEISQKFCLEKNSILMKEQSKKLTLLEKSIKIRQISHLSLEFEKEDIEIAFEN